MCGIFGVIEGAGRLVDPACARDAMRLLRHRGPDDAGVLGWCGAGEYRVHEDASAVGPSRCLLVHRRLSILDLSRAGWQPMVTPDGRYAIIFNGEIYNYLELRAELQRSGYLFRSGTDTEVLLQAFAAWGQGALERLVGMFAFAVLDREERRLFLARDFFGIKPLYYIRQAGRFAFASEIKALLPLPWVRRTAQSERVLRYLRHGITDDGGDTLFRNVQQLPAAHYLSVALDSDAASEPVRYWTLEPERTLDLSFDEAADQLRALFLNSVRLHLRSDVPVGTALSGGVDSSAIVASIRHIEPSAVLHSFSYVAEDAALSEERWVDLAHAATGTVSHKVQPTAAELCEDLDRLILVQDEPFATTSIYAQMRVFRLAREHGIKVMLDGQGADELLAGYWPFIPSRVGSLVYAGRWVAALRLLLLARRFSHVPAAALLTSTGGTFLQGRLRPVARRLAGRRDRPPAWLNVGWFLERGTSDGDTSPLRAGPDMLRRHLAHAVSAGLPALLRFEDRNSMASSIESRVPFLTPQLAKFILALPEEHVLGPDGTTKRVFRRAMRGIVAPAILDRRDKIGFETPEALWLTHLKGWVAGVLRSEAAEAVPALLLPSLRQEWDDVIHGRKRFDSKVWRWINLIRWTEVYQVAYE